LYNHGIAWKTSGIADNCHGRASRVSERWSPARKGTLL
jgi:hypothetical protein